MSKESIETYYADGLMDGAGGRLPLEEKSPEYMSGYEEGLAMLGKLVRRYQKKRLGEEGRPIPAPLFGCSSCYEEQTWPARDLYWSEKHQQWFCDLCWGDVHWECDEDGNEVDIPGRGESLRQYLERTEIMVTDLLKEGDGS